MKLASIGLENLPNVYLSDISLQNTSNITNTGLKIKLGISINDTVDYMWSKNKILSRFMKIVVVQSTSPTFTGKITSGRMSLDPRTFLKDSSYNSNRVQYKFIDLKRKEILSETDGPNKNKIKTYYCTTEFSSSASQHLTYFVASYIDIKTAMAAYGINSDGGITLPYHGPIASETVLRKRKIVEKTNIFLKPNGSVWPGAVHLHEGKYMAGPGHSSIAHETLTLMQI